MANDSFMIFTGTANTRLAVDVVNHLDMSLGKMTVGRFSDGEVMVEINENVRGKDVFVLQPTCAPTNDNLMEIMVMVDALRRASAGRITAAIPYFGYARQDRRPRSARVAPRTAWVKRQGRPGRTASFSTLQSSDSARYVDATEQSMIILTVEDGCLQVP